MKARKRNERAKRPGDPERWGKLTDQLQAKLLARIEEGLSFQTCCDLCGLARSTFYEWIAKGETEPESRHGAFAKAIARAEAEAVRRLHIRVAITDPKWLLERRHPALYGAPKVRLEASGPEGAPIEVKGRLTHEIEFSCTDEQGFQDLFPVIDSQTRKVLSQEELHVRYNSNGNSGNGAKA